MAKMKIVFLIFAILISPVLTALALDVNPQANPDHHPKLVATPANLNFFTCASVGLPAPAPASQTLQIRGVPNPRVHDGDGDRSRKDSLEWTAVPSEAWIHIEPASGFTPDEAVVSVDPAGLAVGEYAGVIEFETPGQEKPRIVQIQLRIQTAGNAAFTLEPASVGFHGEANSNVTLIDSVHLGVIGADHLEFTAANSQSWLKVVPSQATAPITVLLLADVDSLPIGAYYDTVVFRGRFSNDGEGDDHCLLNATSARLPVTLKIAASNDSALVVGPRRLGFAAVFGGPNPQPQNLSVSTLGGSNVSWTAAVTQSWLETSPTSGMAGKIPDTVRASVNITGLNPGLYTDTISFLSSTSGAKVPVFLQIFPPSELTDSVAIGDGVVDLTDPQINRFSVPIFASNTQAVRAIALPLHFEDGQTNLDSVTFAGGRAEFADLKLFLRLSKPGDFLILLGFVLAPALPPGEGTIGWLHFTTTGVLPQFADTLVIDSTSVPNATGDPNMPSSLSVSYLVFSGGNPLILNPAFKKGTVILRNFQIPTSADDGD
ncbi:MAG: hypothetical protein L0209_06220, partial [candidate division Zixibacteria bacterium]|nr:hypothetical protein [candidate division Zixibacteria bacterium]